MMIDNEIIKALEHCYSHESLDDCGDCPLTKMCNEDPFYTDKISLDLINRQKAEIERLSQIIKDSHSICEDCKEKYAEEIEYIKADAVKEFAERVKAKATSDLVVVHINTIDKIVKEMVGY